MSWLVFLSFALVFQRETFSSSRQDARSDKKEIKEHFTAVHDVMTHYHDVSEDSSHTTSRILTQESSSDTQTIPLIKKEWEDIVRDSPRMSVNYLSSRMIYFSFE